MPRGLLRGEAAKKNGAGGRGLVLPGNVERTPLGCSFTLRKWRLRYSNRLSAAWRLLCKGYEWFLVGPHEVGLTVNHQTLGGLCSIWVRGGGQAAWSGPGVREEFLEEGRPGQGCAPAVGAQAPTTWPLRSALPHEAGPTGLRPSSSPGPPHVHSSVSAVPSTWPPCQSLPPWRPEPSAALPRSHLVQEASPRVRGAGRASPLSPVLRCPPQRLPASATWLLLVFFSFRL